MQSPLNFPSAIIAGMADPSSDWFLAAWLSTTATTQATLCRLTGWDKRKASFLVNGRQEYRRTEIHEAAVALNLEPFELLMHPEDAMALRRMRDGALRIAAETRLPWKPAPAASDQVKEHAANE